MFIRTLHRQQVKSGLGVAVLAGMALILLTHTEAVATGISRGLSVCGSVIIPTLYPFMLLSGALADSPLCRHPGPIAQGIARRVFGVSGCCFPAILLSLVGGYPAGMLAVARLYRQRQITREELTRLSAYCVGGGPGFIVGTVGGELLGSTAAGWRLYSAQVIATLLIGIWLGRGHRRPSPDTASPDAPPRSAVTLVGDTCTALVTTCGFVLLAAMVLSVAEGSGILGGIAAHWGGDAAILSAGLAALLEVSCGCVVLAGMPMAPLWLSLALSWAGLSVQGQLAATLPSERLLNLQFWGWRLVHGALSGGVAVGLFTLFPLHQSTGVTPQQALPFSVSAQGSAMLLTLCFLAMLCFSEKKTGNIH